MSRACSGLPIYLLAGVLLTSLSAGARVKKVVIDTSKSQRPAYDAKTFSQVGQYEKLVGEAFGELDPKDPHNALIQDILLAPRNAAGMVEYRASFSVSKPVDMSKSNGVLLYDVVNRGNELRVFQAGSDVGDEFLLKRGTVIVRSGWQGDIPLDARNNQGRSLYTMQVPVAKNPDGSAISGPVLVRFSGVSGNTAPLVVFSRPVPYAPLTLDPRAATLTSETSERTSGVPGRSTTIPSTDWVWSDCSKVPFPGVPDAHKICLRGGFNPALAYQLVFTAKDPLVLGIGFAATRDIISFFRYDTRDDSGTPNPVAQKISKVVSQGSSQSGQFIRTFIHLGFNEDEAGRIVWDGAMPTIAGRQLGLNFRFALPDGTATRYVPDTAGVLWWDDWNDTVRGHKEAGLLDRCRTTRTCPKVIEQFGSSELWYLRMSPGLAGTAGREDLALPDNVRRYYSPGTTHGGGPGGFNRTAGAPARATDRVCVLPPNPNPEADLMRALLADMVDWLKKNVPPPPSRYPRIVDGTLVNPTKAATGFPDVPGLVFRDNFENPLLDYDFGPQFRYDDISGSILKQPPYFRRMIPLLVAKVNSDGNELSGVPSVLHQAPLGTYLGWNITASGFYKDQICGFTGGYVPFAKTKHDRVAAGDPRLSIEERYGTQKAYISVVRAAAEKAVKDRFLLPEDAERLVREAVQSPVLP